MYVCHMVNLEWYRTFKAIYQNGNLTRAAEELLVSQPNVSIQLAALESYIGHKLFKRLPRKLVPTEYGKLLYTQIVDSVQNLERVEGEFRKVSLQRLRNLRIGAPIEYTYNVLIDKFADCKIDVNLRFGFPGDLVEAVLNKDLDFAIVTQQVESDKVVYEPVIEERFLIVSHINLDSRELEQYISKGDIDAAEKWLLAQPWIVFDNKLSIIRRFWRENFKKRPLIKPHFVIPNLDIMLKAVHLQYGITIASDMLLGDSLERQRLKILWEGNERATNQLWLAYDPLSIEEQQLSEMRKILAND